MEREHSPEWEQELEQEVDTNMNKARSDLQVESNTSVNLTRTQIAF